MNSKSTSNKILIPSHGRTKTTQTRSSSQCQVTNRFPLRTKCKCLAHFAALAQQMIDKLLFATVPPWIKSSMNIACLENGTKDKIPARLEGDFGLTESKTQEKFSSPQL